MDGAGTGKGAGGCITGGGITSFVLSRLSKNGDLSKMVTDLTRRGLVNLRPEEPSECLTTDNCLGSLDVCS